MRSSSTVDVWRAVHPNVQAFTWSNRSSTISSRIDLMFCPVNWLSCVSSSHIIPCPHSDHCAVSFAVSEIPDSLDIGPGYWKLNCQFLEDADLRREISSFWASWQAQKSSFFSLFSWWEVRKAHIKSICVRYCQLASMRRRADYLSLCNEISSLKLFIDLGHLSRLARYREPLAQQRDFDRQRAKAASVRARVKWAEEGETSSAYFCRLERKRAADRFIYSVDTPSGSTCTSVASLKAFRDFLPIC